MAARPVSMHPEDFKTDPYGDSYVPLPLADDLKKLGIYSEKGEDGDKSVQVNTRIPTAILYAADRIIERRVLKITSRPELVRTAVFNFVVHLVEEIQSGRMKMTIRRLEAQRRAAAEMMLLNDLNDMAATTLKVVKGYLAEEDDYSAVQALRRAKAYVEDIPSERLRERFVLKLYGSKDGSGKPEDWESNPVAVAWDRVMRGVLDKDDEDQEQGKARLS